MERSEAKKAIQRLLREKDHSSTITSTTFQPSPKFPTRITTSSTASCRISKNNFPIW